MTSCENLQDTAARVRGGAAEKRPDQPPGRAVTGCLLALGAAAAMGSAAPAVKALGANGLSAINVAQGRGITGAALLMTLALVLRRGRVGIGRQDWWLVCAYGVLSLALNHVMFTLSVARLSVGVALLLEYLAPVLVALWVRFVQREPVSGLAWIGIAATLVGLGLVGEVGAGLTIDGLGVMLGLLTAATMASRFVLAQHGLRRHDPLVLAAWGTTVGALAMLLTGLTEPFPFGALTRAAILESVSVPLAVLVGWVGLVGTGLGVLLSVAAQRRLGSTSVSLLVTLEVVVGAGLAYALLGESMTGGQVAGGVIMLTGIAVAQIAVATRPRSPRSRYTEAR